MDFCCASVVILGVAMAALLYLILRFGSEIKYVHLDLEEWKVLCRAYKDAGPREARRPEGRPTYKVWPMSYHRIFGNGIFTDVGHIDVVTAPTAGGQQVGKVKLTLSPGFVALDDVVGIYSVTLIEKSQSSFIRTATLPGLQVETRDFRTILLVSPNFEVSKARAALEMAMGPRWTACFREGEELVGVRVGDHYFRDAHMHKLMRATPLYALRREMAYKSAMGHH